MEFLLFFLLLIDAGGDTTRNLLASGLNAMLDHPDQLAWLKADLPGRLPAAREELLRWTTPVIYMRRTAKADAELGGKTIRKGDKVVMYFGAANRDPAAYPQPEVLDLRRQGNKHLAFGFGPHQCAGLSLARLEGRIAIGRFVQRFPNYRLTAAPERGGRARFRGFLHAPFAIE